MIHLLLEGGSVFVECCDLACKNCCLDFLLSIFLFFLGVLKCLLELGQLLLLKIPFSGLRLNGGSECCEITEVLQSLVELILFLLLGILGVLECLLCLSKGLHDITSIASVDFNACFEFCLERLPIIVCGRSLVTVGLDIGILKVSLFIEKSDNFFILAIVIYGVGDECLQLCNLSIGSVDSLCELSSRSICFSSGGYQFDKF